MWKPYGRSVAIPGMAYASIAVMRLQVHHSPLMRIEVEDGARTTLAALVDLDWSHNAILALNGPQLVRKVE